MEAVKKVLLPLREESKKNSDTEISRVVSQMKSLYGQLTRSQQAKVQAAYDAALKAYKALT